MTLFLKVQTENLLSIKVTVNLSALDNFIECSTCKSQVYEYVGQPIGFYFINESENTDEGIQDVVTNGLINKLGDLLISLPSCVAKSQSKCDTEHKNYIEELFVQLEPSIYLENYSVT